MRRLQAALATVMECQLGTSVIFLFGVKFLQSCYKSDIDYYKSAYLARVIDMSPQQALQKIKQSDEIFLTAADVAPIIGCNPNDIRGQAHDRPEMLGFPVTVYGTRVKIPRIPFVLYLESLPPIDKTKNSKKEA